MSLVTDVDAFHFEHRGCGDLDGGVEQEVRTIRVWMTYSCGALGSRGSPEGGGADDTPMILAAGAAP
jgi:hypothetical protein